MNIILWRHAEAEDGISEVLSIMDGGSHDEELFRQDDLSRCLTAKGHKQAAKMAAELKKRLPEKYQLWVSQALRSQQTGEYLRHVSKQYAELNPDVGAKDVLRLLLSLPEKETVVIVGHQPWIGELCAFLLNQSWNSQAYWSVKKGAFWWFQSYPSDGVMLSKLKCMLIP